MAAIMSWFGSKPDYTEKIPETLTADDFSVHSTFHHGFPSHPRCLAYDPVQQILGIGTETGSVLLLGKPGLERFFKHPQAAAVLQMLFITNQGLLVTRCDNKSLYVWTLKEKEPRKLHRLEFLKDSPTSMSWAYGSEWLYVGTDAGNVQVVRVKDFSLSGYCIFWNKVTTRGRKPGDVIHVEEHPCDHGKLLLAFSLGLCVIWNLRTQYAEKSFAFEPGDNHILTSVSWLGNGKAFACSYSNGSIAIWNSRSDSRPERVFFPHESDLGAWKPIYKLQLVYADRDPWFVFSGGFPEDSPQAPQTLTVMHPYPQSTTLLSSSSTILDFLCLPSSAFNGDVQKPFALAILSQNELVVHDLQTPCFPTFQTPYALDIHVPPVTVLHYCANCPEEFIASLHSVKSKIVQDNKSTKMWPLKGGKWGEESPMVQFSDIILSGHTDGSVRLWCSSSVIFQPFFTVETSKYFRMRYAAAPSSPCSDPRKNKTKAPPPPRPPPPAPRRNGGGVVTRSHPEIVTTHPALEKQSASEKAPSPIESQFVKDGTTRTLLSPTLPTGQQVEGHLAPDLTMPTSKTTEQTDSQSKRQERKVVTSRAKRRSIFGPKRPTSVPVDRKSSQSGDESHAKPINDRSSKGGKSKVTKSIAKAAKNTSDATLHLPEDTDSSSSGTLLVPDSLAAVQQQQDQLERQDQPVACKSSGAEAKPGAQSPIPARKEIEQSEEWEILQAPTGDTGTSMACRIESPTQSQPIPLTSEEEFFAVQEMQMCVLSQSLCVANTGGSVLAFNFYLDERETYPQTTTVNFDSDSVLGGSGQNTSLRESATSPQTPTSVASSLVRGQLKFTAGGVVREEKQSSEQPPPGWMFRERVRNLLPGFHLQQHCQCVCTDTYTTTDSVVQGPVKVSAMQYSVDLGLLVIGTDKGLAVVDTVKNSCLYTLSYLISILYMADPSKYNSRIKRTASSRNLTRKPTFIRHPTILNFSVSDRPSSSSSPAATSPPSRTASAPILMKLKTPATPSGTKSFGIGAADIVNGMEEAIDPFQEIEACDSYVTSLELVHLLLDSKQTFPTLTLWVGTVSGYAVAYGVSVLEDRGKGQRKIELLPTSLIIELKSPAVSMHFLNEWGDRQVVPYKPSQGSCPLGQRQERVPGTPSHKPLNYAVIIDETTMRSFSFPGLTTISKCSPSVDGALILKSKYFTCNDLPCLLTLTSCKHFHIHCLPGLKLLLRVPYAPLGDTRVMHTFGVSGDGQALFMSTSSEIQRISVTKADRLNLPNCLPDVHIEMEDPQPASKGILSDWFGSGRGQFDAEAFFGERSGRALVKVKLDGKEYETGRRSKWKKHVGVGEGGGGGLGDQMSKNLRGLDERGKNLTRIEEQAGVMADEANVFASDARRLAEKFK